MTSKAPAYDAGQLLQWERDWNWYNDQQNVAEEMRTYFKEAQKQCFPQEVKISEQNAAAASAFFTKSANTLTQPRSFGCGAFL